MGLDFSQCDAHWSYSGFHRFRDRIASAAGINLDEMEGFGGITSWSEVAADDIIPLLNHSDCDGELSVEECKRVAPRIRELVANWPDDDYDKRQALLIAEGMENCIANNEPLEFC